MNHRSARREESSTDIDARPSERLQKVLAAAGVGSRRECEQLIVDGRVEIDRQVVVELGTRVDPLRQEIRVDGTPLTRPKRVYFAVNKPPGVVSTNSDPDGRTRVIDLVRSDERLFTIGRLDRTSEGLILVTNDGSLANRLTHPRYEIEKKYVARVVGCPSPAALDQLKRGVHLAEGVARVAAVHVKRRYRDATELEIVLREGRNREIRRVLARIGHKVLQLKRVAVGPLQLGGLPPGACRPLTRDEIELLERAATRRPSRNEPATVTGAHPRSTPRKPGKARTDRSMAERTVGRPAGRGRKRQSKAAPPPNQQGRTGGRAASERHGDARGLENRDAGSRVESGRAGGGRGARGGRSTGGGRATGGRGGRTGQSGGTGKRPTSGRAAGDRAIGGQGAGGQGAGGRKPGRSNKRLGRSGGAAKRPGRKIVE